MECCDGADHWLDSYSGDERRLLVEVEELNRALMGAADAGLDISAVLDALDPDPARYTWVDEGGGVAGAFVARAGKLLADAPALAGHRLVDSEVLASDHASSRPALAVRADGAVVVAWVEWVEGRGDQVVASVLGPDGRPRAGAPAPAVVSGDLADCLRPSAVWDREGRPWAFFGRRDPGAGVAVWCTRLEGGAWTGPERVSTTSHPSFNQEVAAHDDGSLECCWQGYAAGRFGVLTRAFRDGAWGETEQLGRGGTDERNVWDPVVAGLPGGGSAYAWTTYGPGGYRTAVLVRRPGQEEEAYRLGDGGAYSLHPSLAVSGDGTIWCAYDRVMVGGHGGSGPTRLRRREELGRPRATGSGTDGFAVPGDLAPDVRAELRVASLGPGTAGWVEAPRVTGGMTVGPAGLPRIAVAPDGRVALAYRTRRRLPLMLYWWETVVQWLGPLGWSGPTTFTGGDGPLEEPAIACRPAGDGGVTVAWQEDGRRARGLRWTEGFGGRECAALADHYGEVVWHSLQEGGRVRLARLGAPPVQVGTAPEAAPAAVRPQEEPRPEARPWAAARSPSGPPARYRTGVGGVEHGLYWGDLHRHSLISRCTAGDEPGLDDFYRYAWDVCEYDFWAVTDHAENTSAYQWWSLQRLADVLHVDGTFVPFYGFEWTAATGHQNVIYQSLSRGAPIYSSTAAATSTPAGLWDHLRRRPDLPVLTIPHHPGSAMVPMDWGYDGEDLLRLVEVFQACRGSYEDDGCFRQYSDGTLTGTFMSDGLRRGRRFGLIGSSDHGNGASYVGAYATGLSRAEVFDALVARRTLAATTRDIVVDFRLNDAFMGSEAGAASSAAVEAYVRGYTDLARVDLVGRAGVVRTWDPPPPEELAPGWVALPLRVEWMVGSAHLSDWSGRLRVVGGRVLDTPWWSPEVVDVGPDWVAWAAATRNFRSQYGAQRGGVELTVMGPPDAELVVETASLSGAAPLGRVADQGPVVLGGTGAGESAGPGQLRLQRGTGGLTSLGCSELAVAHETPVTEPGWYYLRVFLVDGEMAWSSPVWVDGPAGRPA